LIVVNESHQGAVAMQITTIGLDIAKNVFQVHGIDAAENRSEATSARPNTGVLRGAAALPCGHGGLRDISLLGT
jgi:hypothetical protein